VANTERHREVVKVMSHPKKEGYLLLLVSSDDKSVAGARGEVKQDCNLEDGDYVKLQTQVINPEFEIDEVVGELIEYKILGINSLTCESCPLGGGANKSNEGCEIYKSELPMPKKPWRENGRDIINNSNRPYIIFIRDNTNRLRSFINTRFSQ
jgi:hypothetical protein